MSVRPLRCPSCGEEHRLRVHRYGLPETSPYAGAALVRYECLQCGVFVEHYTYGMSEEQLARFGFSA